MNASNPTKIHVIIGGKRVEKHAGQCRHRSATFDLVACPTCTGTVRAKVYRCSIHGKATDFTRPFPNVQRCAACTSFQPDTSVPPRPS